MLCKQPNVSMVWRLFKSDSAIEVLLDLSVSISGVKLFVTSLTFTVRETLTEVLCGVSKLREVLGKPGYRLMGWFYIRPQPGRSLLIESLEAHQFAG